MQARALLVCRLRGASLAAGLVLLVVVAGAGPARAGEAHASSAAPLDFDLLGDAQTTAPSPGVQESAETRRTMLRVHQGLGIATWAAMLGTIVSGQLAFGGVYGKEDPRFGYWVKTHVVSAGTEYVLFGLEGALALFAPAPYAREPGWDTAMAHRILLGVTALAMVAQGPLALAGFDYPGALRAHQIVGYGALAAMTAGVIVLFF